MSAATMRLPRITPTAAETFMTCPRHFWHEYVARPRMPRRGGPWAHLSLGGSVHQALSLWMDEPPERRTPDRAVALLAQVWQTGGYRDDEQNGMAFAEAADWIAAYTARQEVYSQAVIANERSLSALYPSSESPAVVLDGRIDRIDERTPAGPGQIGALAVVDYKTNKRPPVEADAAGSFQLALYVWIVMHGPLGARTRRWCTSAELHHLPTGEIVRVHYDRERITRLLDRLLDLVREIERARTAAAAGAGAEAFPATPGPLCASCPFLDYCEPGQARATRADGWAFLAQDVTTPATAV